MADDSNSSIFKNLPIQYLRECLSLDPISGELIWRVRPRRHFESDKGWRVFNSKRAQRVAGTASKTTGYVVLNFNGSLYAGHRIAFAMHFGAWPRGHIDHVDGNRGNNAIANLRECSRSQNQQNRAVQANNTSGYKGVHRHYDGRWRAVIQVNKSIIHIGVFDTPEQAHVAYTAYAKRCHGAFANVG